MVDVPLLRRSACVQLVNQRTMGKLVWPAAIALAQHMLDQDEEDILRFVGTQSAAFVELGAGAGLASIVAAGSSKCLAQIQPTPSQSCTLPRNLEKRFRSGILATEMTEAGVELISKNININNARVRVARYNVIEDCGSILSSSIPADVDILVLCSCDLFYDEDCIRSQVDLFAYLCRARQAVLDRFIVARSSNFDYLDDILVSSASANGLRIEESIEHIVSGGLLEELAIGPPMDESCAIYVISLALT